MNPESNLSKSAVLAVLASLLVFTSLLQADPGGLGERGRQETVQIPWRTNYGEAWREAEQSGKMLFIWFEGEEGSNTTAREKLKRSFAAKESLAYKLGRYVPVRLKTSAKILSGGEQVQLLQHDAFREMHQHEGIAIVDLVEKKSSTHGRVVSAFPLQRGKYYSFQERYMPVILDLPRGTMTQRTMIWAVRVHPERPASTEAYTSPVLLEAAHSHCRHQAKILVQGHHNWEGRFHRLQRLLHGRYTPVEVVAESWPNQTMLDSCLDCVASWRHSSGHWHAVSSHHALYGYDIHQGSNGIWYGTGIFAGE